MKLIRGISGVRGIVDLTLTDKVVQKYTHAFSVIQKNGPILIARDSRSHGRHFIKVACKTLQYSSRNIHNCDIIPTPTAQFLVEKNNLAGGIVITASHNPKEWNGLKFIDSDGTFLSNEKNNKLFEIVDNNKTNKKKIMGSIINLDSGYKAHIDHTLNLSAIDLNMIKKKNYTVVIDAVNGAASNALPDMMEALGCRVYKTNCTPNGIFKRGTEPIPEHLTELGKEVIKNNANVGFATDPDGDRLAVVDENGKALGEEYTLTICVDGFYKSIKKQSPIVTNLSTTIALDHIAKKYNTVVIRSKVGEINVVNEMKKNNALIGGEGNGGIILAESHYGRDSLIAATLFINRMAQTNEPVSNIYKSMPQFTMIKDKIKLNKINTNVIIKNIEKIFPNSEVVKTDGIKFIWEHSWAHIRKSNTEPVVRIIAEAPNINKTKILISKIKSALIE